MGYSTYFNGCFKLDKPLTTEQEAYLGLFASTRRMKRDPYVATEMDDDVRRSARLPLGEDAGYFVGGLGSSGQNIDASVLDGSHPPHGQPGLWCQWIYNRADNCIEWNMGEKFYDYADWIVYIIVHFLRPWGYVLNGTVDWNGDEPDDFGRLVVENNALYISEGVQTYLDPELYDEDPLKT